MDVKTKKIKFEGKAYEVYPCRFCVKTSSIYISKDDQISVMCWNPGGHHVMGPMRKTVKGAVNAWNKPWEKNQ